MNLQIIAHSSYAGDQCWCPFKFTIPIFKFFIFLPGNLEIGNGYGVPGGGAYYGASIHNIRTPGKNIPHISITSFAFAWPASPASSERKDLNGQKTNQNNADVNGESGQKSVGKDLPEYLKQKLKARGILKDNQSAENSLVTENVSWLFVFCASFSTVYFL